MRGVGRGGWTRLATVLGISVVVGALLVLAWMPAAASAVRLDRQAVEATADPTCFTGDTPRDPGYDPVTHEMYVPNEGYPGVANGAPNITVLSGTCTLVGTIPLSSSAIPIQAAFDPADNYIYVTDYGLNQVYIISGTKIVTTLTNPDGCNFDGPMGIVYDPETSNMEVVNYLGDDLTDIPTLAGYCGLGASVGTGPTEISYDPLENVLLVTNSESGNISILNADVATSIVYGSITVGANPHGIAYDPATQDELVANTGSKSVSVLTVSRYDCPTCWEVVQTVSGFDGPYGVAWDQSTQTIWVTNDVNGKAYELSGEPLNNGGWSIVKRMSTAADSHALGLAYDEYNDDLYVTGFDTNVVYVF